VFAKGRSKKPGGGCRSLTLCAKLELFSWGCRECSKNVTKKTGLHLESQTTPNTHPATHLTGGCGSLAQRSLSRAAQTSMEVGTYLRLYSPRTSIYHYISARGPPIRVMPSAWAAAAGPPPRSPHAHGRCAARSQGHPSECPGSARPGS
jgi:hypothetical protein